MNQGPPAGSKPGLMGPPQSHGLARYGSAPGSFLSSIADSVISSGGVGVGGGARAEYSSSIGSEATMSRFFHGDSSCLTGESSGSVAAPGGGGMLGHGRSNCQAPPVIGLQRSYGLEEFHAAAADLAPKVGLSGASAGGPALVRHSSLPAGFFSHLLGDQGPSTTRGIENYSQADLNAFHSVPNDRSLRTQWSFSRQDSLSQISELSIPEIEENGGDNSSDEGVGPIGRSCITSNFQLCSWDDNNSIIFSPPSKRAKDSNRDVVNTLRNMDNQFSMPKTSSEMSADKYLQMHHDSVPCRVRAKRGCATHPRSIAERERRTRISKRLKNLQDLVPNMDKQTSTSDMLELAIQHINELQNKIEKLKEGEANCTCSSRHKA